MPGRAGKRWYEKQPPKPRRKYPNIEKIVIDGEQITVSGSSQDDVIQLLLDEIEVLQTPEHEVEPPRIETIDLGDAPPEFVEHLLKVAKARKGEPTTDKDGIVTVKAPTMRDTPPLRSVTPPPMARVQPYDSGDVWLNVTPSDTPIPHGEGNIHENYSEARDCLSYECDATIRDAQARAVSIPTPRCIGCDSDMEGLPGELCADCQLPPVHMNWPLDTARRIRKMQAIAMGHKSSRKPSRLGGRHNWDDDEGRRRL